MKEISKIKCNAGDGQFQIKSSSESEEEPPEIMDTSLNLSLENYGISPIKHHAKPLSSQRCEAKRKLKRVRDTVSNLEEQMANTYSISKNYFKDNKSTPDKEVLEKAEHFDTFIRLLKDKIHTSSSKDIIQLLTLAPATWSIERVSEVFGVTKHKVIQSKAVFKEQGLLGVPQKKQGKTLEKETIDLVHEFYNNDEYSRIMPGIKDCISISKNVHMQKKLILCNLKELFEAFKVQHPNAKIGFSKFCSLRPKWCIIAGKSGTHSVCVCSIHQNAKLLVDALPSKETYKDLMQYLVCSIDNEECMIHRCQNCPTIDSLTDHLNEIFAEYEDDQEINYKQWVHTDRSSLNTMTVNISDFIGIICNSLQDLTSHSYISKTQAEYLKIRKENIDNETAISLGDFAENYSFVVQDEVQSFHWNNLQCTLHPVVLYYKIDETLTHKSFCIISDDMKHDVDMVHEVQEVVINYVKTEMPQIKKIEYFSDGCAGQYKNKKNFKNLCMHMEEFNIDAQWTFFATSHGKSPCDGIGGTLKRATAKASLQRLFDKQILEPLQMYEFCKLTFKDIITIFVSKERMADVRRTLANRYDGLLTIPGTRSFHQFTPISKCKLAMKRSSKSETDDMVFELDKTNSLEISKNDYSPNQYVACIYENKWWIGIIEIVNENERDLDIKFMHPHGPASSFHWPHFPDRCIIPMNHVLVIITPPNTATGRQYTINTDDLALVTERFCKL